VFVVDDNFIGNIREVKKLLPELRRWQEQRGRPMEFYTEASVNLARETQLVADMVSSGFTSVFLGIETPSLESLKSAKKLQNLRVDLVEAIDGLTRAGLEIMGGFIVGFDTDDASAFAAQRAFLEDAPIPMAMVGLLTALPGTALWRRLAAEGRLRKQSSGDAFARPNFVPAMDEETLLSGYAELLEGLYSIEGYVRRCVATLERLPPKLVSPPLRKGWEKILARAVWHLGIKSPRRRIFWELVGHVLRRSPGHLSWAFEKAIQGEHFVRYTREDVLPMVRRELAHVRAERLAAAAQPPAAPELEAATGTR
jgi:radical SAM superfamily enzyme YgiQ (UPF0313 family)